MAIEQVLHMNGGIGETSYANNSLLQRKVMLRAKPVLEESIINMYSSTILPSSLKVADLGCSSGPNVLLLLSDIINIVDSVTSSFNLDPPIFQFFLNDLFGNDFNTIFKSVPEFYRKQKQEKPCFINGTPGSFYGRLFPSNSTHFFHSSYSLHWLSQPPKPLNKEKFYSASMNSPAYRKQFQKDFKLFLRSRSDELVPGGAMVLTFIGRYEACEIITSSELICSVLNDMVFENLVEEAKLECFGMPFYTPTAEEVREIIKGEGSFSVLRLESIRTSWDGSSLDEDGSDCFEDENERGEFIAKYLRAVFEPLLKAHLGDGIMDPLFLRFRNKVVQLIDKLEYPALVISLVKNA